MRKFKKLTMTLALLIMAVGGAWAQSSLNVVELEEVPAEWETDQSYLTAGDLPGFKNSTLAEAQAWKGAPATGNAYLIYAFDGDDAYYVRFDNGAPFSAHSPFQKNMLFGFSKSGGVKFYYPAEPTEWDLTSKDGKNWILDKMPASDVELQVEYYAESNLFLSKEALADKANIAVKAGDLGVQFGEDGKSANTITEGTPMTVTYNGTKKVIGFKVEEKKAVDPANAYMKWDADQKKMVATEIPTTATKVENSNAGVEWQGTYVVDGEVNISGTITLSGDVDLIIKDGAKLTAQGISGESKNLYIYGQANQSGQLVVNSSGTNAINSLTTLEVHSAKVTATSSYDYCGGFFEISTFNVYGGSVDAKCTGSDGLGIGLSPNGSMKIYGGEVKAEGTGNGGIFYYYSSDGKKPTVTVYGGKLWAGDANKKALYNVNLTKGAGFTGKIETSADNSAWAEYTEAATPTTKYVRVGY